MSRIERGIAALLLATAVAGGALIPHLLSQPAGPVKAAVGVALVPRPGEVAVQAPPISKRQRPATHPTFVAAPQAKVTPARLVPVVVSRPAQKPSTPVHHSSSPPTAPSPPSTAAETPTVSTGPVKSDSTGTRPGNGFGDKNHVHTGPPGQASEPAQTGSDVEGSGHGRPVPQAAPDAVGAHGRRVGHLAKTPPAAAAAAHAASAQARPEDRGQSGHSGSPPPGVGHGHSHGH